MVESLDIRRKLADFSIKGFISKNTILLVLLVLIAGIGISKPNFLSANNLMNILIISSVRIVIALGAGGILITRGVDLSAGRTVGLAACIAASLIQRPDYANKMYQALPALPLIAPILAAMFVGLLVGIFNGTVIAFLKVPPFIATLGAMVAVYGFASIYIDKPPLGAQPIGGLRNDFTELSFNGPILPWLVIIALLVVAAYWFMLNKTVFGKNLYAIGGNPDAANVAGVSVSKNLIMVYATAGLLYGLAGAMLAARTGSATNNTANGYELDAIAACVIGGVSTYGGVGTIAGILTGVFIFEVLNNGLVVLGVSTYWQQIIKGIIIITAVAVDIRKYLAKK
ncbi:MAG: galactose/methyl galactoside ABC transporter permease MglC [Spirochaetia bacterium]